MCLRRSQWPEKWVVPDRRPDLRVGQAQGMLSPVEGRPSFSHCDRNKRECGPAGKITQVRWWKVAMASVTPLMLDLGALLSVLR